MDNDAPSLNETYTLEFYVNDDKTLHVIFNKNNYHFSEFWKKIQNAEQICNIIHNEFRNQFPKMYQQVNKGAKDWKETFLRIVNNHFNVYDKVLDVFIRSSGEVVFKLEH